MTQTGYSNAIVNAMLSWLKGLASWVLRLFNLSGGVSPLKFLADNWMKILIFFLILGVAADLLVWLIRWRPHWVWFRKKRVIINDKNFFAQEKYIDDSDDWDVPARPASAAKPARPRRNWEDSEFVVPGEARRRREERMRRAKLAQAHAQDTADIFQDGLFNVNAKQRFSDKYEDEVFNVSDLPKPERATSAGGGRRRSGVQETRRNGKASASRKR